MDQEANNEPDQQGRPPSPEGSSEAVAPPPADAPPADTPPAPQIIRHDFAFTGEWQEYFGIWIVNILLTIVTLGVYSAWAKVRRQRWFYGHTNVSGAAFEYHARPVQILIGRVVVLALIGGYNLALNFFPIFGLAVGVAFLFAVPWFIARGLRFNARVTSWRGRRFDFTGTTWGAWPGFILWPMAAYSTGGILAPFASKSGWSYVLGKARFAGRDVACDPDLDKLFRQLGPAILVLVGGVVLAAALIGALAAAGAGGLFDRLSGAIEGEDGGSPAAALLIAALVYFALIPFLLMFALAGLIYRAGVRNVVFNATVFDGRHMLHSSVNRWRYLGIAVTNFLATVFSFGLARPWAAVRMAKFMAAATAIYAAGGLDHYVATELDEGAAAPAEYLDVEGFDFGF